MFSQCLFGMSWFRNFIFGMVVHIDLGPAQGQGHILENANLATSISAKFVLHVYGQGHLKLKVIPGSNCKCLTFYRQPGDGPSSYTRVCTGFKSLLRSREQSCPFSTLAE